MFRAMQEVKFVSRENNIVEFIPQIIIHTEFCKLELDRRERKIHSEKLLRS